MSSSLIGKVVTHNGKQYQILSVNASLLTAHSYGIDYGIEETIFASKSSGKIIATKTTTTRCRKLKK